MRLVSSLIAGQSGIIKEILNEPVSLKLIEMGFRPGKAVKLIRKAPLSNPLYIKLNDHYVALRREEADVIVIEDSQLDEQ